MQITIERRYRRNNDNSITFFATFWLTLSEPKPVSASYLFNVKISELARWWYMLEAENPQHVDINAQQLTTVLGWNEASLKSLASGAEFSSDNPVTLAAVEEGVRRCLAVLPVVDRFAEVFTKQPHETTLDLETSGAAPTGFWVVKP